MMRISTLIKIFSLYFVVFMQFVPLSFASMVSQYEQLIAIDVGHSVQNFGALSSTGVKEYDFNINIANMLLSELDLRGYINIIMINKNGGDISLKERAEQINKTKADMLISIHHDSVQPQYLKERIVNKKKYFYTTAYKGFSVFFSKGNVNYRQALRLAKLLGKNFVKNDFTPTLHHAEKIKGENRELVDKVNGVYNADFAILRTSNMPSILVECGIIVNPDEEKLLKNMQYQTRLVKSIASAVDEYYAND